LWLVEAGDHKEMQVFLGLAAEVVVFSNKQQEA
jgi:hypothetical protein